MTKLTYSSPTIMVLNLGKARVYCSSPYNNTESIVYSGEEVDF